jgi:hypothetical protein
MHKTGDFQHDVMVLNIGHHASLSLGVKEHSLC